MIGSFNVCPRNPAYDNSKWQCSMRALIYGFVVCVAYWAGYRIAAARWPMPRSPAREQHSLPQRHQPTTDAAGLPALRPVP
jgi:hypothetical protein